MATATSFKLDMDRFGDEIDEHILVVTQKFAFEALSRVVLKSPVDTGRFRGNWTVTINAPTYETAAALDVTGAQTIAKGQQAIFSMPEASITYVQNNLPYGPRLEGGWSKQAPAGMVAVTFAELELMIP